MTLAITDRAVVSQTGNVRRSNEDSYLVREPLFVVADGMGGAQAGEIASRMAADEFAETDLAQLTGEAGIRDAIVRANLKIHQRARAERVLAGMGTTVAVALFGGGEVVLAHVGDSRAYLLRAGGLQRLSNDHSLVGEMVRAGELTEADAERHPQRSVITRALGAEPDVEVDTMTVAAEAGDVFMLCTDGLNSMVDETEIARLLAGGGSADELARDLVRAALKAGGEDNVTAIVFRVGEAGSGTREMPAVETADEPSEGRSTARTALRVTGAIAVACVLAAAGLAGLRWSHFVGADEATGRVAIYQGIPVNLPFGAHLYRETYVSPIAYATLSESQRRSLFDHRLRSASSARQAVDRAQETSP